jgi:outer membrane biosynthesis protein TonB
MALSAAALAAGPGAVRKRAQSSMLVTGTIVVAPDGTTRSYTIDRSDKLPPFLVKLIDNNTHEWRFVPTLLDGKPVAAKAGMSLRIVAVRTDKDNFSVRIAGAQFGQHSEVPGETITSRERKPPTYPVSAVWSRVSGTVYLLLRVDRQGQVEDAVAQQVNLRIIANDLQMAHWRKVLADAALDAARKWTFDTPTAGKHAGDRFWVARVPVSFGLTIDGIPPREGYGEWDSYIPGPVEPVMWPDPDGMISSNVDAQSGDGIYQLDQGLRLLTPLNGA